MVLSRVYSLGDYALCEAAGGELNRDFSHHTVEFPDAVTVKSFEYSAWLEKCDAVINFSKLKAHGLMGMTAAVKNLLRRHPRHGEERVPFPLPRSDGVCQHAR